MQVVRAALLTQTGRTLLLWAGLHKTPAAGTGRCRRKRVVLFQGTRDLTWSVARPLLLLSSTPQQQQEGAAERQKTLGAATGGPATCPASAGDSRGGCYLPSAGNLSRQARQQSLAGCTTETQHHDAAAQTDVAPAWAGALHLCKCKGGPDMQGQGHSHYRPVQQGVPHVQCPPFVSGGVGSCRPPHRSPSACAGGAWVVGASQ